MESSNFRCGFVSFIGRPNVGKSTLLNRIIGERLAAVSPKAQTTRKRLRGILTDAESQIIFIDTPGVHKASEGLKINEFYVSEAFDALSDADIYVYIIDGSRPFLPEKENGDEKYLLECLKKILIEKKKPLFILLSKKDVWEKGANKFSPQEQLQQVVGVLPNAGIFPISAKTGEGLELFLQEVKKHLPLGPALYPSDEITDQNLRSIVADLIQEKLFYFLGEELPYSCAVEIEKFQEPKEKNRLPEISASIHVERESQKPMVIGKGGMKIKEIGQSARESIEKLMGQKIVLKLFVKVTPKWTKNADQLKQLGYALPERT